MEVIVLEFKSFFDFVFLVRIIRKNFNRGSFKIICGFGILVFMFGKGFFGNKR